MGRPGIEPQQERSADTRRRILDAAIACLATRGYAATTTTLVGEHAGVSRGALLYHFPSRQLLVSAAVAHLFAELRSDYQQAFAKLAPRGDRLAAAIDLLWRTLQDPRLVAVLELWLVARNDHELHEQLVPVSRQHHHHIRELARGFFPEVVSVQRFDAVLNLLIDTLQGAAIRQLGGQQDAEARRSVSLIKTIAASLLDRANQGDPS